LNIHIIIGNGVSAGFAGVLLCWLLGMFVARLTAQWLALAGSLIFFVCGLFLSVGFSDLGVMYFLCLALILNNAVVLPVFYWEDKRRAMSNASVTRIPENVLHTLAFAGGAIGALAAQWIFRHKTKKREFRRVFYVSCVANVLLYYIMVGATWPELLWWPWPR